MNIYYYVTPDFADSHWMKKCLSAIQSAVGKRKYSLVQLFSSDPEEVREAIGDERTPLIVIGTSRKRIEPAVRSLSAGGVRIILLNCAVENPRAGVSAVMMDYEAGMRQAMEYLSGAHPEGRIALFGMNPDAFSDMPKHSAFLKFGGREEDVFWNDKGLEAACEAFAKRVGEFGAVICVCDIVALALRTRLRSRVNIPEELLMMSFADVFESEQFSAAKQLGITTIQVGYEQLGHNAVRLARFLYDTDQPLNITVKLIPQITVSASTRELALQEEGDGSMELYPAGAFPGEFFEDSVVQEVNGFCRCLYMMTAEDERLVRMLIGGQSRASIAETLHMSESTLYERIRMLCKYANCSSSRQLAELMARYL